MDATLLVQGNWESLPYFWPSIFVALAAGLVLVQDLFEDPKASASGAAPFLSLLGLGLAGLMLLRTPPDQTVELFSGMIVSDPFSWFFQAFFLVVAAIAVAMSARSREIRENKAEFYAILLVLTVGMILLASANDLLMLYLALETVSICSYILTGWSQHSRKSSEASLKYLLYGAVASGIMLYGLSILYGMTGATGFHEVAARLAESTSPATATIAALLVFAGFAYKIASVPFHMWAPDVYQGAPTPVTAFLTVGPKAAGFAALIRFFYGVLATPGAAAADGQSWTASLAPAWPLLIGFLSIATMTVGNLSAMHQTSVKRLLGFSSIAHAGYLLMGFVVLSQAGLRSVLFYLIAYCAMNIGAFLVTAAVSDETGSDEITAFRGLSVRSPFAAVSMAIFLFSLVGLPPLAGFTGKLHLFAGVIHRGLETGGGLNWYYVLALAGIANSVVSLFYYMRIARAMFLEQASEGESLAPLRVEPVFLMLMGFLVLPTLALGLFWGTTMEWAHRSIQLFTS